MGFLIHWKFCVYRRSFDLRKGPTNTLTPLSLKSKNANINSNRKSHISTVKVLQLKRVDFIKNGSGVSKP